MYEYLICVICPLENEYEPGEPECGFLFPAFLVWGSSIKLRGYLSEKYKKSAYRAERIAWMQTSGQQEVRSWEKCLKMKWLKMN